MIPALTQSGVLPPYHPNACPSADGAMAPYCVSLLEVAHRFATTPGRVTLLRGLLSYRNALRAAGFTNGFQWIDGSFVENVEATRGRPPQDIDLITFAERPAAYIEEENWSTFVNGNLGLFLPSETKKLYQCDAYFVELTLPPRLLVNRTKYWFGLFSHQRESFIWKGLLEIPLTEDSDTMAFLNREGGDDAS